MPPSQGHPLTLGPIDSTPTSVATQSNMAPDTAVSAAYNQIPPSSSKISSNPWAPTSTFGGVTPMNLMSRSFGQERVNGKQSLANTEQFGAQLPEKPPPSTVSQSIFGDQVNGKTPVKAHEKVNGQRLSVTTGHPDSGPSSTPRPVTEGDTLFQNGLRAVATLGDKRSGTTDSSFVQTPNTQSLTRSTSLFANSGRGTIAFGQTNTPWPHNLTKDPSGAFVAEAEQLRMQKAISQDTNTTAGTVSKTLPVGESEEARNPDLELWLEMTGWNDEIYRKRTLKGHRIRTSIKEMQERLRAEEAELAELMDDDDEDQTGLLQLPPIEQPVTGANQNEGDPRNCNQNVQADLHPQIGAESTLTNSNKRPLTIELEDFLRNFNRTYGDDKRQRLNDGI